MRNCLFRVQFLRTAQLSDGLTGNPWEFGEPETVWIDEDSVALCIKYTSGKWFHYRLTPDGCAEWW